MKLKTRDVLRPGAQLAVFDQTVRLAGVLREVDTDVWLSPVFTEVHDRAVETRLREVVLDLRRLEYANAGVWRCIVEWLRRIRESRWQYRLRVRSELSYRWQRVGLPALSIFGDDWLQID